MKSIKLSDLSKELGKISQKTIKEQRAAVARGLARSIPYLVEKSPVDTGLYAASWSFTVDDYSGIIGNSSPYAGIIEDGARPFTPPIAPLLEWAHRVLSGGDRVRGQPLTAAQQKETGKSKLSGYSNDEWALAKAAQNAISRRGMIPHHIMRDAIPQIIEYIKEELERK